jgi:hypothetical protein
VTSEYPSTPQSIIDEGRIGRKPTILGCLDVMTAGMILAIGAVPMVRIPATRQAD